MAARVSLCVLLAFLLAACAPNPTPPLKRVALLAPFEGQSREVGYQALYAARMALAEHNDPTIELLAIDDGGTPQSAALRLAAIQQDPLIVALLVAGENIPSDVQLAIPIYTLGSWGGGVCGDACTLESYRRLTPDLSVIEVQTVSPPVDTDFAARYRAFDTFAPTPLPLARHAYDTTQRALLALMGEQSPPSDTRYTYRYTANGELTLR